MRKEEDEKQIDFLPTLRLTKPPDDNIIIKKGESMEIIKQIDSETLIIKELKNFLGRKLEFPPQGASNLFLLQENC